MFETSAEFYDLIYSTFKDYASEARQLAQLLRKANPGCRTLLDVACGTGEHARHLAAEGFVVDGLDLDAAFVRIAREKHPLGRFFESDMSDFFLPHRYDAVVCLFSSIGYVRTLDRVEAALTCFRQHLAPNGIIAVEPWFGPGALDPSRVAQHTGEADGLKVTRTSRVAVDGRVSRLYFDYEIVDEAGTRVTREIHELGLFTTEEMLGAFERAGLAVEFDPKGLCDRGLYLARRATDSRTGRD